MDVLPLHVGFKNCFAYEISSWVWQFQMDLESTTEATQTNGNGEIESFFNLAPPLRNSADIREKLENFIKINEMASGKFTFWYFVKAGYAVIFLHRRGTFQPFCRSLPDDPLLECFESIDGSNIKVQDSYSEAVERAIAEHHSAVKKGFLLKLPFTTIFEYLQMLRMIALSTSNLGPNAMFYLAAAVSDFYVPWQSMAEHKIQSASGPLNMQLAQVPKMLPVLRQEWAPKAFLISFKLETDSKILLKKATAALEKYKMDMVVANELLTRKEEVVVVTSSENITVRRDKNEGVDDVEDPLIQLLVGRHSTHINTNSSYVQ
uniref:DNA/pantothenate metabolism flavoprotein C-terminal domain-containing protein n=1 Tax=Cannabis sativa TaxID=3483 RepID=A0A803NNE1_CANSA